MSGRVQSKAFSPTLSAVRPVQSTSPQVAALSPASSRAAGLSPLNGIRLQRKCGCGKSAGAEGECADCRKKKELQRHSDGPAPQRVPSIVHDVLATSGQPLNAQARESMEQRFGHDFSQVRVHSDARANESARAVNALAFTVGSNIVFAPGQYQPASQDGRRLLAHELTHVVQQHGSTGSLSSLSIADADSPAEHEADRVASNVISHAGPGSRISSVAPALHKQEPGGLEPGLGLKYQVDPKLTAEFLAMCSMGKGDPKLCAQIRMQSDPALSGSKLADPGGSLKITPEMMREAQDRVNPPTGGNQAEPAAKDPPAPPREKKGPWSSDPLSGTIVEYKSPAVQFKVSIPDGVAAKFRAQIHDAQFLRINIGVSTSAKFTASIKVDDVPIEISSTIDPVGNKASVSLRVFGTTGKCATTVAPSVVAKIQDAGTKVEAAWKAFQAATATPAPSVAAPSKPPQTATAAPPPTGLAKDFQDVKNTVQGVVDKVQPEIEMGKAIAAFVAAVEAVEAAKKTPCAKASIMFGATYDTPLQPDVNDPLNRPKLSLGLSGTF